MAKLILVMGESGSGKTTAMRNLPPAETLYIDCDGKGLAWKGWKSQYNRQNVNYFQTSNKDEIMKYLGGVEAAKTDRTKAFKYVVIDTINGIMVDDEFARMAEKGYDKWQDLAQSVYGLISFSLRMRPDLTVIFLAHSQTERDDNGFMFTRVKTSGKKLDKIVLESKFPVVLLAKNNGGRFVLETQSNNSTAKTPMGAIEDREIDNDIMTIIKALEDY